MSLLPASRVQLKKDLYPGEIQETANEIRKIAGKFNMIGNNPVVIIVGTTNPDKLNKIRALPHVAKVGHQL